MVHWPEGRHRGRTTQGRGPAPVHVYGWCETRMAAPIEGQLLSVEVRVWGCGTSPQTQALALQLRRAQEFGEDDWRSVGIAESEWRP